MKSEEIKRELLAIGFSPFSTTRSGPGARGSYTTVDVLRRPVASAAPQQTGQFEYAAIMVQFVFGREVFARQLAEPGDAR